MRYWEDRGYHIDAEEHRGTPAEAGALNEQNPDAITVRKGDRLLVVVYLLMNMWAPLLCSVCFSVFNSSITILVMCSRSTPTVTSY